MPKIATILPALAAAFLSSFAVGLGTARADQVVVTDVTYDHSATTTSDSHYRVDPSPETPADLTTPVDYASGVAYVRLEVLTKPTGDEPTRFQVCFKVPSALVEVCAAGYGREVLDCWPRR